MDRTTGSGYSFFMGGERFREVCLLQMGHLYLRSNLYQEGHPRSESQRNHIEPYL